MGGKPKGRLILGWREWIAFPELSVGPLKAKIDTGALTSALHAEDVRIVRRGGNRFARFTVPIDDGDETVEVTAPLVAVREIKSSNGIAERRPIISTQLAIGGQIRAVELSLTDRDTMGFRVLLGRQAIRRFRAAVDPLRSFATSA